MVVMTVEQDDHIGVRHGRVQQDELKLLMVVMGW